MRALVASAAVVTAFSLTACASKARQSPPRYGDQIDRARWEKVCGPFKGEQRQQYRNLATDVTMTFEHSYIGVAGPRPPGIMCMITMREKDHRIESVTVHINSVSDQAPFDIREAYGPIRDLLLDFAPPETRPALLVASESPVSVKVPAFGMSVEGGFMGPGGGPMTRNDWSAWDMDVRMVDED